MSKEVHDLIVARWEGFKTLAKTLPNHHILAVELFRTLRDETTAVFTVVRHGEPVRYVVTGDAHGRVKADNRDHCETPNKALASLNSQSLVPDGGMDPSAVAIAEPPPHQPGTPGIVAVGAALLSGAFDVAEFVDTSPK